MFCLHLFIDPSHLVSNEEHVLAIIGLLPIMFTRQSSKGFAVWTHLILAAPDEESAIAVAFYTKIRNTGI